MVVYDGHGYVFFSLFWVMFLGVIGLEVGNVVVSISWWVVMVLLVYNINFD